MLSEPQGTDRSGFGGGVKQNTPWEKLATRVLLPAERILHEETCLLSLVFHTLKH